MCSPVVTGQKINHVKADSIVTKQNKETRFTRGCIIGMLVTVAFISAVAK